MAVLIDRVGSVFGRLKVVSRAPNAKGGKARWVCECDCGAEVVANAYDLATGRTQSCGCLHRERTVQANASRIRHGHARKGWGNGRLTTPEYRSWKSMVERCRNQNAPNYHLYGGRGIAVCDRWLGPNGFNNFLSDMGQRLKGMTIDRIDNDAGYEPGNCRWATAKEQRANQRNSPELDATRRSALDRGRRRTWDDPELRAKLLASRRKK